MKETKFTLNSTDGTSKLSAFLFEPEEEPRAVLQLCHGMCEYITRYRPFIENLCGAGFAVAGLDHLGHGTTAELNEAPLGYFGDKNGWEYLVEDQEVLRREMAERFPGKPYFLLGHSMGSFIARLYAARHGEHLTALVLSGTAGKNPAAGIGKFVVNVVKLFCGKMHRSKLLFNLTTGGYNKGFTDGTTVDWLTRDLEVCRVYEKDPWCSFTFTAAGYHELLELLIRCNSADWYKSMPKDLPIFLYSGDHDPVGGFGKGVKEVYEGLKAAGCEKTGLTLYPDGRHEMHNEFNKEEVITNLVAFLEKNIT